MQRMHLIQSRRKRKGVREMGGELKAKAKAKLVPKAENREVYVYIYVFIFAALWRRLVSLHNRLFEM